MSKPEYSFKKLIFLGLDDRQIDLVKKIKTELGQSDDPRYWVFMNNHDELHYHLDQQSIVIVKESVIQEISPFLLQIGHPVFISWKIFLKNFYSLVFLETHSQEKKVCLAFIPKSWIPLYETLFLLYGIQTVRADTITDLERILNSGMEYLVFDLDMNQVSEKEKFKTMQSIKYFIRQGLTASVIKNFDKGSLFNDLMSPVKDISNILLSPEEYLLFLRKYLYLKDIESFNHHYGNQIEILYMRKNEENPVKNARPKINLFHDLKDAKKIYSKLQSLKSNLIGDKFLQSQKDLYLRYTLSENIAELIERESDNSQRELFTFFSR